MENRDLDVQTNEVRGVKATNGNLAAAPDRKNQWVWMADSPAVMHRTDATGGIVEVNKRWCELTGRTAAEAMGTGWKTMIHPDDREALAKAWEHYVREANRGLRKDGFTFEYRLMHKDGTSVRMCARCAEERDDHGILLGFYGASLEIPESLSRPQTAQTPEGAVSKDLSAYFATKATPAAMYRTDVNGSCLWVSEKWVELSGYSAEDALGDGWQRVIHPGDLERLMTEWQKALAQRTPFICESRYLRPDGKVTWVCSRISEQLDEHGKLIGYLGVVVDITELHLPNNAQSSIPSKSLKRKELTKREKEVMRFLCEGLSNKQVAMRLGLSVRTIEAHRARIMVKLRISSVVEMLQHC